MKRFLLSLVLISATAFGADDSCSSWRAPNSPESSPKRCVTVSTFTNIATGATCERSVAIAAEGARLVSILLESTNCANCDLVISDISCTTSAACTVAGAACTVNNTAANLIYSNDAILAATFYGVAYSQHLFDVPIGGIPVIPAYDADTGERRVFVRILNGDASSDDDVTLTLVWES